MGNTGSAATSNGLTVDLVDPIVFEVREIYEDTMDLDYINQANSLNIWWSSNDELSGIDNHFVWFGTTSATVVDWTEVNEGDQLDFANLELEHGGLYHAMVRAVDIAGNESDRDAVLVDLESPVAGIVLDGHEIDQNTLQVLLLYSLCGSNLQMILAV